MASKCVCQICTCGRHYCKHLPTSFMGKGEKPCRLTEYNAKFKEHKLNKVEPFRPEIKPLPEGKMENKTVQRVDFQPYTVEKPWVRQLEVWKKPPGNMEGLTSYKKEFTGKHISPPLAIRHDAMPSVSGKFQGEPTYKSDYKKWDASPMVKFSQPSTWRPPSQKLDGESTFSRDFRYSYEPPRKSLKPANAAHTSDAPLDDKTGYRTSYIEYPLPPKYQKEKEQYSVPQVPLDDLTTFKRDFQGQGGPRMQSCRPEVKAMASGDPFQDMTTFKNDFKAWPIEKPYCHLPDQYMKPPGKLEHDTTHKLAYREFPIKRTLGFRPASANKQVGNFDGKTNYSIDFKPWEVSPMKVSVRHHYVPPVNPFKGISTQKAHFVEHPINVAKSYRPQVTYESNNAPLEDKTMYRREFTPKEVPLCPATLLENDAGPFSFEKEADNGHRFYNLTNKHLSQLTVNRQQVAVA